MKTIKTQLLAAAVSVAMLAGALSAAEHTNSVGRARTTTGWNNPGDWDDGLAPVAGDTYRIVAGGTTRSPNGGTNDTFLGDALIVDPGAFYRLCGGPVSVVNMKKLVLNGGRLDSGNTQWSYMKGPISVTANSLIYGYAPSYANSFFMEGPLSGSGNLTVDHVRVLVLSGVNNDFHGNWIATANPDGLIFKALGDGSLGYGNVDIGANVTLEVGYDVVSPGKLTVAGAGAKIYLTHNISFSAINVGGVEVPAGVYPLADILAMPSFATYFANYAGSKGTVTVDPSLALAPPVLLSDLSSVVLPVGGSTTFHPRASGAGLTYVWTVNDVVDATVTNSTYTLANVSAGQDNTTVKCTVANANGTVNTAVATVRVSAGPVITSAANYGSLGHVVVAFNKPVDTTAATFTVSGGVTVSSTATNGASAVVLTTSGMTFDTAYTVSVTGLKDSSGNPTTPDPATFAFVAKPGGVGYFASDFNTGEAKGTLFNYTHISAYGANNNQALKLTDAFNSQSGNWIVGDLGVGATTNLVSQLSVQFKVNIGGSSSSPLADGFCFAFGSDLPNNAWANAEDGVSATGLNVMFDTYDNGGGEAPAVDVKLNGVVIGHVSLALTNLAKYPDWVPVNIELTAGGRLSVSFGTTVVMDSVQTDFTPMQGRFGFGGRTGGLNANQWIDDLVINAHFTDNTGPVVITVPPANVAQVERESVSFGVAVTGSPDFTYQWKTNGTAIAGATSSTYSTVVSLAMNGTLITVDVTNPFGTVTSPAATLTVTNDITPPRILAGTANELPNRIRILFSEPILDTADINAIIGDPSLYLIKDSLGNEVSTASAIGTISTDRKSVAITGLALVPGEKYTVELESAVAPNVLDLSGNALVIPAITPAFTSGLFQAGVIFYKYDGLSASENAIGVLTGSPNFPYSPNSVFFTGGSYKGYPLPDQFYFHTGTAQGGGPTIGAPDENGYGAYAVTMLVPTETGNYTFQAFSDDSSVVSLSTDANPANKRAIITQTGCCAWLASPTNIYLVAGQVYYMEAMYKEGGGGDGIFVQWKRPSDGAFVDITSANTVYVRDVLRTGIAMPAGVTVENSHPLTISATITNAADYWQGAPYSYQWSRSNDGGGSFLPIEGGTNMTLSLPSVSAADNNAQFRLAMTMTTLTAASYTTTYSPVTLSIIDDVTPPTVQFAAANSSAIRMFTLLFNEPMDPATAQDTNNYSLTAPAVVYSATLQPDGTTVVLYTSVLDPATQYTLGIQNVADNSPNKIPVVATNFTFTTPFKIYGLAKREKFKGGINDQLGSLKSAPTFINNQPMLVEYLSLFETPKDSDDAYGQRVSTYFEAPTTTSYRFAIASDDQSEVWLSPDYKPANMTMIASVVSWTGSREFAHGNARPSADIPLVAGGVYYLEALHAEGSGGDNMSVAVGPGGVTIANNSLPIGGSLMFQYRPYAAGSTTVAVTQQPTDTTGYANGKATFTVAGEGANPTGVTYQWQRFDGAQWNNLYDSANVAGAQTTTLELRNLDGVADDQAKIRCLLTNPGGSYAHAKSAAVTLTVLTDSISPYVVKVTGTPYSNVVMVTFSELLFDHAIQDAPTSFTLTGPGVNQISDEVIAIEDNLSYLVVFNGAPVVEGETYTLMGNPDNIFDKAFNYLDYAAPGAVSNFVAWSHSMPFAMQSARFNDIPGAANNFATTQSNPKWPDMPDEILYRDSANSPANYGDNYTVRMIGYFVPPETGFYRFRVEADDAARVKLTTDIKGPFVSANAQTIFNAEGDCGACDNDTGTNPHYTSSYHLIARVPYYLEFWIKEGGGGDYLYLSFTNDNPSATYSVWPPYKGPGNITSNMLVFAISPEEFAFTQQPASVTTDDGTTVTLACQADYRAAPASYQWQRHDGTDFVNISGATSRTYQTPVLQRTADNGAQYRCLATVYGNRLLTSSVAVITVNPDTTKPVLVSAFMGSDYASVNLGFSKALTASSVATATFTVSGGVAVRSAALSADGKKVLLVTDFQMPGPTYTVTVTGVEDTTELHNAILPDSQMPYASYIFGSGVRIRRYDGITGSAVTDLTGNAAFPNSPTVDIFGSAFTYHPSGMENYGAYLTGAFTPAQSGNYRFYTSSDDASQFFLSTDANPANKVMVASETGCCGGYQNDMSPAPVVALTRDRPYYVEALIKEGTGGDYLDIGYSVNGGPIVLMGGSQVGQVYIMDPFVSVVVTQQPPATLTVNGGQSATLAVMAESIPNQGLLLYQWQKNGVNIPNATSSTLVTPALLVNDSGVQYRCLVTTKGAAALSEVCTVTVAKAESDPPVIAYAGSVDGRKVGVRFNEVVYPPSVLNAANYTVTPVSGMALASVVRAGDVVVGIPATYQDPPVQSWPNGEPPSAAVDGVLRTKYLNFAKLNTGFTVTLAAGAQALQAIRLTSANDAPERDPASYLLEGSNNGTDFTVISSGALAVFPSRGCQQTIQLEGAAAFSTYRVTFPTVADEMAANSMQIAEVELLGVPTAAPTVTGVVAKGGAAVELTLSAPVTGAFTVAAANVVDYSDNTNATTSLGGTVLGWGFLDSSAMVSGNTSDPNPPGQVDWAVSSDTKTVIKVGGTDIWGTADGYNFIYKEVDGDFDISTRVESIDPSSTWAKAGVMIRESLAANSRNHNIIADPKTTPPPRSGGTTGANMIEANARYGQGSESGEWNRNGGSGTGRFNPVTGELPYPNVWVRMVRQGGMLYGYASTNGVDYTQFISETDPYPSKVYVGRCTTSHNQGDNTIAVYSDFRFAQLVKLSTDTSGGTLKITWPADPSNGYILQGAFSLQPGAPWLPVTQGIITNGDTKVYTVPSNPLIPSEFYRLIKP